MTQDVVCCFQDADTEEAARIRSKRLPLTAEDGEGRG